MAARSFVKLRALAFIGNYQATRCVYLQQKLSSVIKETSQISRNLPSHCLRSSSYCTSAISTTDAIEVEYHNGLPRLLVPLPSRRERCQFTLRPISHTLGDLYRYIQTEDHGIDRVLAYTLEGNRIAQSTPIDMLLQQDFELVINDQKFLVKATEAVRHLTEHMAGLCEVKNTIAQMYSVLNVETHQMEREKELLSRLEGLQEEIAPLEKKKAAIETHGNKRTHTLTWFGLGLMSLQFGILARLTWWEYSWDIMEPVTYFVTYGTSMAMYAYYVLTRQEYTFPDARNREFLWTFYRKAKKDKMEIERYNKLKDAISQAEHDLARLRDPLQMHLPIKELEAKKHPSVPQ